MSLHINMQELTWKYTLYGRFKRNLDVSIDVQNKRLSRGVFACS